jgi:hypothetical protein
LVERVRKEEAQAKRRAKTARYDEFRTVTIH